MRTRAIASIVLALALAAPAARAARLDGSATLGGTIVNQTGDRTAVQETFDLYDGFTIYDLRLDGNLAPGDVLLLDLRDLNLKSRQGEFVYQVPGALRLDGSLTQHRQLFSPDGGIASLRKDWRLGAELTPARWLALGGRFGYLSRDGDRLPFPPGTLDALGLRYDNALRTGEVTADVRAGRRGGGLSYQISDNTDGLDPVADRRGQQVAARLYAPCLLGDRLTHFVRASYGTRRLSNRDLEYRIANVLYTGVLEPIRPLRLKYQFEGNRLDDQATGLRTERFVNLVDAAWTGPFGQVNGGYAYETNDDDRSLTSYNTWHAGLTARYRRWVSARFEYASRSKEDLENLTLLQDMESSQIRARLELRPWQTLVLGSTFARREREFPGVDVELKGDVVTAYGRYDLPRWGALSSDYSHSVDDARDRLGGFHTRSDIVTGRVEVARIPRVTLAGGVTWLDVKRDLDIEKSILFAEGTARIAGDLRLWAAYNGFNYDDYVLLDRYYTANVLRLGIGYDLHVQ